MFNQRIFLIANPLWHARALGQLVLLLSRYRQLTWEMTKFEIQERYAGQFLGTIWALGHPLFLMGIYVLVFGHVFKIRLGGTAELPLDYTAYLLAGLIPWLSFQDSMSKSTTVVVSNSSLVKQVVFPLEVLPVKGVLASAVAQVVSTLVLLIYVLLTAGGFPVTYLLLPVLMLFQILAMVGVSYVLASIGVFFRDIKDIVVVLLTAGMFLTPSLYVPGSVPNAMETVFLLNPFSYMIWCYQDAAYFGRFVHASAWLIFPLSSVVVFYLGFRVFRALKPGFGNVL